MVVRELSGSVSFQEYRKDRTALLTSEKFVVVFINVQLCHKTTVIKVPCLLWFVVVTVTLLKLFSFCKQVYKHNFYLRNRYY